MSACGGDGCPSIWQLSLGICCPFNVTARQVSRFKEQVTWVDLFSLAAAT